MSAQAAIPSFAASDAAARISGTSENDEQVGDSFNDSLHGIGGDDVSCFGDEERFDSVEQLADGNGTLWFESGGRSYWDPSTLSYDDGVNQLSVSNFTADKVSLEFGDDGSGQYDMLVAPGAFTDTSAESILEDKNKGFLSIHRYAHACRWAKDGMYIQKDENV